MSGKIVILVSDLDDASHGEVNILESPDQAAHFVETLLESGFEQERIRVFGGDEMAMQVHHRPVVSLTNPTGSRGGQKEEPLREVAPQPQEEEQSEAVPAAAARARSVEYQEASAEPFVRNGVRFSSMFKPA